MATSFSLNLPLFFSAAEALLFLSRIFLRSLSIFSLVMMTLEGSTPTWTVAPETGAIRVDGQGEQPIGAALIDQAVLQGSMHIHPATCIACLSRLHADPQPTIDLLPCQALNVNDPLLAVDSNDLALAALQGNRSWMHELGLKPITPCTDAMSSSP